MYPCTAVVVIVEAVAASETRCNQLRSVEVELDTLVDDRTELLELERSGTGIVGIAVIDPKTLARTRWRYRSTARLVEVEKRLDMPVLVVVQPSTLVILDTLQEEARRILSKKSMVVDT